MPGYEYGDLYDIEKATGVDFDLGWQGLSAEDRRKVKDYYRSKYGPGWRRQLRLGVKQPARAAGRLGVDITPEKGAKYESFQETLDELKETLERETGENIREYTISALEQAERGGMPAGTGEAIARYSGQATEAANRIIGDAERALTELWESEKENIAEAIGAERMRGRAQTGKTLGTLAGAIPGLVAAPFTGGASLAAVGPGAQLGSTIFGGDVSGYEEQIGQALMDIDEETKYFEELLARLQNPELYALEPGAEPPPWGYTPGG